MSKMASLESPTMKTLIANTQELIALLSSDPELIAGTLLSTNFIQGDVLVKVFGDDTPTGQAAIMFEAVVNEIEKAPEKLFEFLGILTEHLSATKLVDSLYATYEKYKSVVPNQTAPDDNQSGQPSLIPQQMQSGVVPNQMIPDDNQTGQPTLVPQQIQSGADADQIQVFSEQVLTEKDVIALLNLIHNFSDKWNVIGLGLGFTQPELNQISSNPSLFMSAPASFLTKLLSQWVQWPTVDHPIKPTLCALCETLRSSLVGLGSLAEKVEREMKCSIAGKEPSVVQVATGTKTEQSIEIRTSGQLDQVDDNGRNIIPEDISNKIETLEDQFDDLQTRIIDELSSKPGITVQGLLSKLTRLPLSLREEYQSSIAERIPSMSTETQVNKLFIVHLNPLISFIDYGLIEHVIKKFGSDGLREDMQSYCCEVQTFMKQTTIQQLIHFWPGKQQTPENFEVLKAKIGKNANTCTLDEVNTLRRRFCAKLQLSEVVFCLIALEDSNSFIISWLVPSVLVPDLIQAVRNIEKSFFDQECVISLYIGNRWLYNSKLFPFGAKLRDKYQQPERSPSPVEWIPLPTKKIFRLAMIHKERVQRGQIEDRFVRMTISGRVDDILHAKSPVKLENIFRGNLNGGEIILIEGAPGSGKSTLTVHICQRWGKGELFQQFTVVILVQLRDPAVQRAQTIADLIPVENAQEIAAELIATNGRGVLWVLDGWDELPPYLQEDSIFCKLLPPKCSEDKMKEIRIDPLYTKFFDRGCSKEEIWMIYLQNNPQYGRLLNEYSVLVTSRPISSGDLHPVVSSRIEVLGFTPQEQRQYFTECLQGDTKALEALLEKIQENPVVQSICYLPLNAAFIVHNFKYKDQSLPNTEHEIYVSVILSCIQRHLEREGRGHDLPRELASLDDLSKSEAVREPFQCLCKLAYRGVMENKVTFSSSDLPQGSNTLSLLQATESFLQSGKSMFYNFLHLSIQEVLSAYYIATWLSDSEQVSQFQQLFDQPRFTAVFQFYAAITKLKNPGIREVIARIIKAKSRPLLVSLLRCLHEAQDPSLCNYVADKLVYHLNLSITSLSPLDCLFISFFLFSATGKGIYTQFSGCHITDHGAKCLAKYLDSDVDRIAIGVFNLQDNDIHEEGASHIARMLHFTAYLNLSGNPIGDTGASLISEAVRENATLKSLSLTKCGITSKGAEDLSRALTQNDSLEKLEIGNNNLGDEGISHVAEALKLNKQLKELEIGRCGMMDKGAASLASALTVNNSLKILHMATGERTLTEEGLSTIAHSLTINTGLVKVDISYNSEASLRRFRQDVDEARKRNGLPPIEMLGSWTIGTHSELVATVSALLPPHLVGSHRPGWRNPGWGRTPPSKW